MASTQIYKCNKCEREIGLFQRGERETMLLKIKDTAYKQMYCLDCYEISRITKDALVLCEHCGGVKLSDDYVLPCGCKEGGELITDEYSVAMF